MQKMLIVMLCLLTLGACASKAERAKWHEEAQSMAAKISSGTLVELHDDFEHSARIYAFIGVLEIEQSSPEVKVCDVNGFCMNLTVAEFNSRLLEIIPENAPDFPVSVHRYLTGVVLKD
jgi:hypothetical protein